MILHFELGEQSNIYSLPFPISKQTALLPLTISGMGHYKCDPTYYTLRKGQDNFLLLYTISGAGRILYEEKEHILLPGQVFVMDCRKEQYYGTYEDHWNFLWIHFQGKCAPDYTELLNAEDSIPLALSGKISFPDYYDRLQALGHHFDLQKELQASLLLQELMTDLINLKRTENFSSKYGSSRSKLNASLSYLQSHYKEALSIEQAAEICHLSKCYFIKVFKAYTGQTPYDYLLQLRLHQAQRLLVETSLSVGDIAQETGFNDDKNFIACFKKKIGQTPLQYRKLNRYG